MKYKDYMKLMKTPYDELSEQDQKKRKKEFEILQVTLIEDAYKSKKKEK